MKMNSRITLLLAAVLLVCAVGGLSGCQRAGPEQRLRDRIETMQAAIEAHETGSFMSGIAENFVGDGGMDRQQLRGLVAARLLAQKSVGVNIVSIKVALHSDQQQAEVIFNVVLTGGSGGLIPERAGSYAIRSGWRDGPEDWQVISADWKRGL